MTASRIPLNGLQSTPISGYLGALGVLRLVSEQADPEATGHWRSGVFVLKSQLDARELESFFLERYAPTPLLAPWNGGSGFYPKDKGAFEKGLDPIERGKAERFSEYRKAIDRCRQGILALHLDGKPDVETGEKDELLRWLRGHLDDQHLFWLESSVLMTADGSKYPPLLGSGGNDGRLEFSANFMRCLVQLFDPETGAARSKSVGLLRQAAFEEVEHGLGSGAIGQFAPGSAGGVNATTGFEGDALTNPWQLVLAMEGAVGLSSVAVRRYESDTEGALSFPFTVRASGVGYGSADDADISTARAEIWFPLWTNPTSYSEVHTLFAEGRATVGGRRARNGVDFYRAIATLGTDRGIKSFERYGLLRRNGLAYLAIPTERVEVQHRPGAAVLADIDQFLDRFRSRAGSESPPAVGRLLQRLDTAVVEVCRRDDSSSREAVNDLLIVLGEVEIELARRPRFVQSDRGSLQPVPRLNPRLWLPRVNDAGPEFELARALASIGGAPWTARSEPRDGPTEDPATQRALPMREYLAPVSCRGRRVSWAFEVRRAVSRATRPLEDNLIAILTRLIFEQESDGGLQLAAARSASLEAVTAFLRREVDDRRLFALLRGLSLLDWGRAGHRTSGTARPQDVSAPDALYGLLKLCFAGFTSPHSNFPDAIPMDPRILRNAARGHSQHATELAARRLRGSGRAPAVYQIAAEPSTTRRAAAALTIPCTPAGLRRIEEITLRRDANVALTKEGETP